MNVKIIPSRLEGTVSAPSSKSLSHRMIIAAALGSGVSTVKNVTDSEDIKATSEAMKSLGAQIGHEGSEYRIKGIFSSDNTDAFSPLKAIPACLHTAYEIWSFKMPLSNVKGEKSE